MKVKNLAIIEGENGRVDNGSIYLTCVAVEGESAEDRKKRMSIIDVRSDVLFSSGSVKFKFMTKDSDSGFLLAMNGSPRDSDNLFVGYSFNLSSFVIGSNKEFLAKTATVAGSLKNYDLQKEHEFKMQVVGSEISIFVDSVLMCEEVIEIKEQHLLFRISTISEIKIYDIEVEKQPKQAFVVMQFSKQYDEIYSEVIAPVCREYDIEAVRADEYYSATPIIDDITRSIRESSIIIADITPDNPNVFYEIGYAHAIKKPVILLSDKNREKLPFDISSFRTIFYENSISGKKRVEDTLRKFLKTML